MGKSRKVWYADFETTQVDDSNEVSVYLWACVSDNLKTYGDTLDSFMEFIKNMRATIYFHNLSFDFSYIHHFLISHNIDVKILEKGGQFYQIKFLDIELRDTLNFFPNMTLKKVGENYNKIYQKSSIEHIAQKGHKPTQDEIDYCINDCLVLQEGHTNYMATLTDVLISSGCDTTVGKLTKKLTNAGIAFEAFKELSDFDDLCPKTTQTEYSLFRGAYRGGFVYSNPKGIVKNVKMIDNNSIYPYCYSTYPMPIGRPIRVNGEPTNTRGFYIVGINIKYELKKGNIPIIGGGVGRFGGIDYKASSNGEYESLTVCNIDLDMIKQFYDCDIQYLWTCEFDTMPKMFANYCDMFLTVKNRELEGSPRRNVAKVMLNSPYGKCAMNGLQEVKRYDIDDKGIVSSSIVGFALDDDGYKYLPIAIAITAYARRLLLTTAKGIGFKNVQYMDTDSIKYTNVDCDNLDIDKNRLGAWKDEGTAELFKTIAPKKYAVYKDGKISYTCAGFSKKTLAEHMFHNQNVPRETCVELMKKFDKGLTLPCLQSKKVKGGRAILTVNKTMS